MKKKQLLSVLAVLLTASMACTGCMSSTVKKNAQAGKEEKSEEESKTENQDQASGTEGNYTDITLWDDSTEGEGNVLFQEFADGFGEAHGIKVERVVMKMDDLRTTIKAAINAGEGPDIFTYEIGSGYLGVLANGGLAYDLTETAKQDGWNELFKENALTSCQFNDGLYGVGNQLESVGVYYNKGIFEKYNLQEPETYEEFEEMCRTLKENGETPLMLDDLDQWPGYHYESIWLNAFAGCDKISDILALEDKFSQEDCAIGLDKIQEAVQNGWTIDAPNAMGHDDARKMFLSGKIAMYPTGTWEVSAFGGEEGLGEDCGFFFLPAPEGKETSGVFGLGQALVINGKADADKTFTAIKFLEYMFDEEHVNRWLDAGLIPATNNANVDEAEVTPLFKDAADTILTATKMGSNLDVLMPTKVNEATANYMQELLAGKKTGMECMEEKQKVLDQETEEGNYKAIVK
ncbi:MULTISPECIES: sugar ABC transporter substrate-binding protein [Blautia]|uniref:sugar ABC transporter substrate-binding protein n=1 Tax=Blautia TaxID=572511 RepID=UPI000BA478DF|nr:MULTISPECIES: extracellular solute-binding protein [Blautia]